jgi:alkylation response protein AidB-like acyl-CoA dehydrogenase
MSADAEDLRLLRDSVADFCARESPLARARSWREQGVGWDRVFWRRLASQGWAGLLLPEALGGADFGLCGMAEVAAGLATVVAPEPVTSTLVLAGPLLAASTRVDLVAALASGHLLPALAWQDTAVPKSLDCASTSMTARAEAGGWRLNGHKHHVRPGAGADGFIVSASGDAGLMLCWVPASAEGLGVARQLLTDGSWQARLDLADVFVPGPDLLLAGEAASTALTHAVDDALVIGSVELQALTGCMLKMTTEYLCTRQQFGKPIGSFQSLQHMAVDLLIQQELSAALTAHTLEQFDAGLEGDARSALASRCKSRCADAAQLAARQCVQLHGAIGYTDEYDLGLFVQRAHVLSAWLGNPLLHRRRYAALASEVAA